MTCHEPNNVNVSQQTSANESLVIGKRWGEDGNRPTKLVSLDRLPRNQKEALALVERLTHGENPTGAHIREVSAERMRAGEWSAARWRDNSLDEAMEAMASWPELVALGDIPGVTMKAPGHGSYTNAPGPGARRPLLNQKGGEGQTTLLGHPDSQMRLKARKGATEEARKKHEDKLWTKQMREYGAHLFLSTGNNPMSGRLMAVACTERSLGMRWKPVQGINLEEAKAIAVWMNSIAGRLQMMAVTGGKALIWPTWQPKGLARIRIPSPAHGKLIAELAKTLDRTGEVTVARYDEGYGELRETWDQAVWEGMGTAKQEEIRMWAGNSTANPWSTRNTSEKT